MLVLDEEIVSSRDNYIVAGVPILQLPGRSIHRSAALIQLSLPSQRRGSPADASSLPSDELRTPSTLRAVTTRCGT